MEKEFYKFKFNFKKKVDCCGDMIKSDTVVAVNLAKAEEILSKEYFLKKKEYEMVSAEKVKLFGPIKPVMRFSNIVLGRSN